MNFVKFLRTPFLQDTCGRLLPSRELCAVLLDSLIFKWRCNSNLLKEVEIKRYVLPSLWRNSNLGATGTDFMVILQYILITASSKDFQM